MSCRYTAVIEDPDGITYTQPYDDFDELRELKDSLGDDYWIVDIFPNV